MPLIELLPHKSWLSQQISVQWIPADWVPPRVLDQLTVGTLASAFVVLLWLGLVGGLSELARRQGYGAEFTRKIVHIGAGQVILLAWWLPVPPWMGIVAAVVAALVALLSYQLPILPGINSVGRRSLGTFFYATSIGVVMAWFWPQFPYYGVIGILIMSWGDGLAALIGQRWGRHPYQVLGQTKSWVGSLTMLIASFTVVALVLCSVQGAIWQTWAVA
ncbi:MAG: diacylglycerol/polyprenol kinase family protein, partial [Cyanobacteria bacterium P01_A01_bin.105]